MNFVQPKDLYARLNHNLQKHSSSLVFFFLVFVLLIMISYSTHTYAQGGYSFRTNFMQVAQQSRSQTKNQLNVQSNQQAAQMVKARLGGKVLKVQKQNNGYRVKLIKSDGHIVSVYIDARSGSISGDN